MLGRFSMLGGGGARAGAGSAVGARQCDGLAYVNEHRTFERLRDHDGDSGGDGSGESESNAPLLTPAAAVAPRQWEQQW